MTEKREDPACAATLARSKDENGVAACEIIHPQYSTEYGVSARTRSGGEE